MQHYRVCDLLENTLNSVTLKEAISLSWWILDDEQIQRERLLLLARVNDSDGEDV